MDRLHKKLEEYGKSDFYPFHMPGHKRNQDFHMDNPYFFDVTEVEGMDEKQIAKDYLTEKGLIANE